MRLAEIRGAVDADEFLHTVDPKLFKRWRVYFRVRDAEAWRIAGHIAAAAWNAAILSSGAKSKDGESLLRDPEYFIPQDKQIGQRQGPRLAPLDEVNVEAYAAELQDRFGAK